MENKDHSIFSGRRTAGISLDPKHIMTAILTADDITAAVIGGDDADAMCADIAEHFDELKAAGKNADQAYVGRYLALAVRGDTALILKNREGTVYIREPSGSVRIIQSTGTYRISRYTVLAMLVDSLPDTAADTGSINALMLYAASQPETVTKLLMHAYLGSEPKRYTDRSCGMVISAEKCGAEMCLGLAPYARRLIYLTDSDKASRALTEILHLCMMRRQSLASICRTAHIRRSAAKRRLERLTALGLVTRCGRLYSAE